MMRTALLLALLLAGPGPTDEGVVYEPEAEAPEAEAPEDASAIAVPVAEPSAEPEPTPTLEPTPAPEISPAPEASPVPTAESGAAEPSARAPLELPPPPLPPPPPPPNGNGRLVGGSITLALGLAAGAAVGIEASSEEGNPQFVAATFIPLGLAGVGIGTYLLVRGVKARSNYLDWQRYTEREARPTGEGMLVGGVMTTVIGGVTVLSAAVQAREPDAFETPLVPTLFGVGGAAVLGGVGLLTAGLLRRSRYATWRQSTFLSGKAQLVPSLGFTRRGAFAGVSGRF